MYRRSLAALLAAVILGICPMAVTAEGKLSDVKKGKEIHAACQPTATESQKSYLSGYVTGSADASMGKHLCPKDPVSTQQLVDAFCGYLSAHPKNQNRPAGLLLGLSFSEAWPCR